MKDLRQIPRPLQNMLHRLRVKCIVCGQTEIERGSFDDHIQKVCPKTIVPCQSADMKCPWTGQRNQLNQHLVNCRFEPMRSVITQFIAENQHLKNQVNQQTVEITAQTNITKRLLLVQTQLLSQAEEQQKMNQQLKGQINRLTIHIGEQHTENQQLKGQIAQLKTQVNTFQHENQQLNEQLRQKGTQIKYTNSQSQNQQVAVTTSSQTQLACGGHACPNCNKCRDWDYVVSFKKRSDATCRGVHPGPLYLHICWCKDN